MLKPPDVVGRQFEHIFGFYRYMITELPAKTEDANNPFFLIRLHYLFEE
jgi:hypothetical protein